jgi:hypothetical protein
MDRSFSLPGKSSYGPRYACAGGHLCKTRIPLLMATMVNYTVGGFLVWRPLKLQIASNWGESHEKSGFFFRAARG